MLRCLCVSGDKHLYFYRTKMHFTSGTAVSAYGLHINAKTVLEDS